MRNHSFDLLSFAATDNPLIFPKMRPDLADAVMTNPTRFAELFRQDLANRQSLETEKKKQQEVGLRELLAVVLRRSTDESHENLPALERGSVRYRSKFGVLDTRYTGS